MAWEEDAHRVMGSDYQFQRMVSNMKCGKRNVDGHLRMGPHMGESLGLSLEWLRTPTVHETQVCEQQIAWPVPSMFFT